jgi:hypothetical protein
MGTYSSAPAVCDRMAVSAASERRLSTGCSMDGGRHVLSKETFREACAHEGRRPRGICSATLLQESRCPISLRSSRRLSSSVAGLLPWSAVIAEVWTIDGAASLL